MKSDYEIWESFRAGDKQALALIFQSHYPALYDYGLRLSGRKNSTKDCLQDFYLYLFEHRKNLSSLDNIRPYLFKSFRRMFLRQLNQSKSRLIVTDPIDIPILQCQ